MDYPVRWKQCVSCQFWGAKREFNEETQRVVLAGGNKTPGRCNFEHNNYSGLERIACGVCPDWQQWDGKPEQK